MTTDSARKQALRRENTYYLTFTANLIALICVWFGIWKYFPATHDYFIKNASVTGLLVWGWCKGISTLACRAFGLSKESTETVAVQRAEIEGEIAPLEPVEFSRGCPAFLLPVCFTALSYLFGQALIGCPHSLDDSIQLTLVFSCTGAAAIFTWKNLRKPEVRVDEKGIGSCDGGGFSNRTAEWKRIQTCEFVTKRDVFGKVTRRYAVARDEGGKKLLTMQITSHRSKEGREVWERVVAAITLRLSGKAV